MASHVVMPVVGFGVFVMMQRQMLGIKTRAERLARERRRRSTVAEPPATTAGEPMAPAKNGRDEAAERTGARDGDRRLTSSRGTRAGGSSRRRAVAPMP